ncbi:hypothetical protein ACWGCW_01080 [Streptomyces sp. NPDC054933]
MNPPQLPAQLPPAVPEYRPDLEHLHAQLGQAHAYVGQLGKEMRRRAEEANRLDDENLSLKKRVADLEAELEALRNQPVEGVVV